MPFSRLSLLLPLLSLMALAQESVDWMDVGNTVTIIGKLGLPLGTAVEVEATIISGESLPTFSARMKHSGSYFLSITRVDDRKLSHQRITAFTMGYGTKGAIPNGSHELYQLRTGKPVSVMTPALRAKVEPGFIGTRYRLFVYETGNFRGYPPRGLPEEGYTFVTILPDPETGVTHRFRPRLIILEVREVIPPATAPAAAPDEP